MNGLQFLLAIGGLALIPLLHQWVLRGIPSYEPFLDWGDEISLVIWNWPVNPDREVA